MNGPSPPATPSALPTVLRSLTSAVLLDRSGDVTLTRETRGAPVDWGGVYAQHVRLCGPWRVDVELEGTEFTLPATLSSASVDGDCYDSRHRLGDVELRQRIVPLPLPPGAVRELRLETHGDRALRLVVTSRFEPFLLPVLVEGIRPVAFELESRAAELRLRHRGFAASVRSSEMPSRLYVDRASWRGGRRRGPVEELGLDYELTVTPGRPVDLRLALLGGVERDLDRAIPHGELPVPDPGTVALGLAAEEAAWLAGRPTMELPDAPELERAYGLARDALRRLYSRPTDGMTGLVAGYPWYSAIWCRDLAWMLPAVLWLGDFSWAAASLATVFDFQATHEIELLAAEPGELPMQLSPGPVFLFGTSDTTLYYPALVRRLLRHAGDPTAVARWQEAVARVLAWAERRSDPASGLFRHGGEAEGLARASGALARVRYGIDAPDTTIWDSTDRREHAIDLQVLWHDALRAAAELPAARQDEAGRRQLDARAERLATTVRSAYLWPEEGYLYDSLRDGRPVRQLRPNALRAVSAGLLAPEIARAVVRRAAADDLSASWGVRTLATGDPGYVPDAYHDGQVWTIATAWAADAAFAVGDVELGLRYLRTIASRYDAESGGANECYRGDRPEPFDSCFLLGFSVGPFLTVLFERLWGLAVDAELPRLGVTPSFPSTWRRATLERLRVGEGVAGLRWEDGRLTVRWSGSRPLEVVTRTDRGLVAPAGRLEVAAR